MDAKWKTAMTNWTQVCPSLPPVSGMGCRSAGALHSDTAHVPGPGPIEAGGRAVAGGAHKVNLQISNNGQELYRTWLHTNPPSRTMVAATFWIPSRMQILFVAKLDYPEAILRPQPGLAE